MAGRALSEGSMMDPPAVCLGSGPQHFHVVGTQRPQRLLIRQGQYFLISSLKVVLNSKKTLSRLFV